MFIFGVSTIPKINTIPEGIFRVENSEALNEKDKVRIFDFRDW